MRKEETKTEVRETIQTLPGDDVRQVMWRFSDRFDIQMIIQSTRSVSRGIVAQLVASGARQTHEWTQEKNELLNAFDEAGITSVFVDPEYGGFIEGPKNLALALTAFELAWVDGGAATCSLATSLGIEPIGVRGTPEQKATYFTRCVPKSGEKPYRGAFALTEPLPFVGVDTGILAGKIRVVEWKDGSEPILHVEKRGRFITNMAFASFVTAAVESDDEKIKGSCMVILENTDPGVWDVGSPTLKMVHQLSSTSDPIFNLRIPADRIIGGYTIKDGVIIPNYSHSEIIEAVFMRTRVAPGLMTAAKLLSAVEPVIRYHRQRFHGGDTQPGTPRYELGLQQKEDVLIRLIDVWSAGEASASLGFSSARLLDSFDPIEEEKDKIMAQRGLTGGRAVMKALGESQKRALEVLRLESAPPEDRDTARIENLKSDPLTKFVLMESELNVIVPATKLWAGFGASQFREALSLIGGYAITEDCPGFLMHKWMDSQLEATYEGPEAVQRRQMSITMTNPVFLAQVDNWVRELKRIASERPESGACMLGTAFEIWKFTLDFLMKSKDANGKPLYHNKRQGVCFPMADAIAWLLSAKALIDDLIELDVKGHDNPALSESIDGLVNFYTDISHVHCARASSEAGKICAELYFGYRNHPKWDDPTKHNNETLNASEFNISGICSCSSDYSDDNHKAPKAGPCVSFSGCEDFFKLRARLDGCLTGSRLAKERAAYALTEVMIPEALDYPK